MSVTASATLGGAAPVPTAGYIRNEAFDATLLVAPFALAVAVLYVVSAEPPLYSAFLLADLWLLGYHHVVATYTRLAFDGASLRRNRFLAVDLLVVVVGVTVVVALTAGAWVIASAFLYLQWFHYMRQGYGIGRMYFRSTPQGSAPDARDTVATVAIYVVPVYAIAYRSATLNDLFLGLPVQTLVLPTPLLMLLAWAAVASVAVWVVREVRAAVAGRLDPRYTAFVASHLAIFYVGYIAVDDADIGWLAVNVWHNLQYVLVVWMMNLKRFAGGTEASAGLLSRLSQPGRVAAYFVTCLVISSAIYLGIDQLIVLWLGGGLVMTVGVYMGINFHHYVVDALIWKRRRAAPQPV